MSDTGSDAYDLPDVFAPAAAAMGFQSAKGKPIEPSEEALARAKALLEEAETPEKRRKVVDSRPVLGDITNNVLASPVSAPQFARASAVIVSPASFSPADENMRTPVRTTTPVRAATPASAAPGHHTTPATFSAASASYTTPAIRGPARIQNGILFTNSAKRPRKALFKTPFRTPFKDGIKPEQVTPNGLIDRPRPSLTTPTSNKGKRVYERVLDEVFQLESPHPQRLSYRDYGLRPNNIHMDLPDSVLHMTLASALQFQFQDTYTRGVQHAISALKRTCALASADWIKNHWAQIVWKRACLIRLRPEMEQRYFHFHAILDQLKYRYEREMNRCHRSCLKRIIEHDSSPALPMVLFVSHTDGDNKQITLSDAWYQIVANIDDTLLRAITRKRIVVGTKIALVGAKITSSEGQDPIEAFNKKSVALSISGNSTKVAAWDSRLGFHNTKFVAGLNSLTSDGGVISLMALTIDKLFPPGYIDVNDPKSPTWGEAEESARYSNWVKGREQARDKLLRKLEKTKGEWESVLEYLQDLCGSRDSQSSTNHSASDNASFDAESTVDSLMSKSRAERDKITQGLSNAQALKCLASVIENVGQEKADALVEIEYDLEDEYPTRQTRRFRTARAHDSSGKKTALITVWDYDQTGPDDFLIVGKTYLVSNLAPKGSWSAHNTDLTLTTRRDTKWRELKS